MRNMQRSSALKSLKDPTLLKRYLQIPLYEAVPPAHAHCFPEYLRQVGYYCSNNAKTDYQFTVPNAVWNDNGNQAHWRNRQPGQPFFSVFNIEVTHESQLWKMANEPLLVDKNKIAVPPYYPDVQEIRDEMGVQYSNIVRMDNEVGKILAELKADDLYDSTIIFFFSDHGDGFPRAKRWLYDSGIKVPLMIKIPGETAGTEQSLISFVDFAPSMLSLSGQVPSRYFHGQAFLGRYQAPRKNRYVFAARDRHDVDFDRVRSVRDLQFKYIKNYFPEQPYLMPLPYRDQLQTMQKIYQLLAQGFTSPSLNFWSAKNRPAEELYDTKSDPHEIKNLVADPSHRQKLNELREQLLQWQTRIPDLSEFEEKIMVSQLHPGGKQTQTATPLVSVKGVFLLVECATPGASIAWKPKNSQESWQLYSRPVPVSVKNIEVQAHRIGYLSSELVNFELK